jgi:hypothetical protein
MASRRESAAPARNAASASLSGGFFARAQAGNAAGAAIETVEGPENPGESARASMRKRYATTALLTRPGAANRRACRLIGVSDKVALSDVILFIVNHARFEPANRPKRSPEARRAARGPVIGAAAANSPRPHAERRMSCYRFAKSVTRPMTRLLPRIDQLAFADLVDKCHEADFAAEFPANGALLQQQRAGRSYWYYRGYAPAPDGGPPARSLKYVGPAGDPDIERRVAAFGSIKADHRARRDLASRLRRAGLPAPLPFDGAVVAALAKTGLFRLRAVLVGSAAYQSYAGLLGVKLVAALYATDDVDVAQDFGVSLALDDQAAPVSEALRFVDPSFVPIEKWSDPGVATGFRNARGFKVEFLTTRRGSPEHGDKATMLPALDIGAQALAFLDFLIREPVRSALLHNAGVAVIVPTPNRFAVHKLIVAARRSELAKSTKDVDQAAALIDAFEATGRQFELREALEEAWSRGPAWRSALRAGLSRLPPRTMQSAKSVLPRSTTDDD